MGGGIGDDVFDPTNQFQIADTVSWTHGKHTIRAGAEYRARQLGSSSSRASSAAILTINSFQDFLIGRAGCDPSNGACSVANPGATNGGTASNISCACSACAADPMASFTATASNDINWFAQDDWKVNSHLTLNLGVRWEYDGTLSDNYGNLTNVWDQPSLLVNTPAGVAGAGPNGGLPTSGGLSPDTLCPATSPGSLRHSARRRPGQSTVACRCAAVLPINNFAPRFGFAWQPFGSSNFVVRGGVGLFYDRVGGNQFVHSVEQGNPYAGHAGLTAAAARLPFSLQQRVPAALRSASSRAG